MLDIRMIRNRPEAVREAALRKGISFDVEELLAADDRRRELMAEAEELRAQRNRRSAEAARSGNGGRKREMDGGAPPTAQGSALQGNPPGRLRALKEAEAELRAAEADYERLMLRAPNLLSPDTPPGRSDKDNVELRRVGEPPQFAFEWKDHVELARMHGIVDAERGAKIGGARQILLLNAGQMLHRAVQQLALDLLQDDGFELIEAPIMVKEETLVSTGFFPGNEDQCYRVDGADKWLAGTAEVPLVSMYGGEMIDLAVPKLLAACTPCFRSEVGSAGRDVRGLYRVHQFAKVEQVALCRADLELAGRLLERLVANAERLLQLLELPYRIVAVCAGDLSQKNYKQFDIETWMPSRGGYGETHSASLLLDFQARRSRIRYRDEDGRPAYAFTLNNTMVATPRILIPLLETHQEADGSIRLPAALRPYMRGMSRLEEAAVRD